MKSFLFAVLMTWVCLPISHLAGQSWATGLFESPKHEFGVVALGAKTVHVFKFRNTTSSTIRVSGVRTSCQCTIVRVLTPVVEPGQVGQIEAAFNTTSFKGKNGANVTVTFTSPTYAEAQLRVDGFIRSDVLIEPGEVNFGNVVAGDPGTKTIQIHYIGSPSWALESVRNSNAHLKTELVETRRAGSSILYQLKVSLDPQMPLGYLNQELRLVTNEPNKTVPVMVNGLVSSPIQVPSVVDLGRIRSGEVVNKIVVVNAQRAFTVIGIVSGDSRVEADQPKESKKTHMIKLTFSADREGDLEDEIILKTDDPAVPEARFKVTGHVSPKGE